MRSQLLRRQNVDIRRAIEQNRLLRRLQSDPQHAVADRLCASLHHAPDAVQLIMTVERQPAGEMRQQRFTAGFYLELPAGPPAGLIHVAAEKRTRHR